MAPLLRPLRLGAAAAVILVAGCSPGTVRLAYRPAVGDVATYRTSVRAVSVTTVGEGPPRRRVTSVVLTARHRVLEAGPAGSRVEVRLRPDGGGTVTFVVRFDRAGQLSEVQRIEGLPAAALGDLGLSELFPAAAAAPPRRPLAPGDSWTIGGPVRLPGSGPEAARLDGKGRLVGLAVADGRRLARVDSTYRVPVRRTADDTGGRAALEGTLGTRALVAYDLDDREVQSVHATSSGRYALTLLPPAGIAGAAVPGVLEVEVTSSTSRIR